MWARVVDRRAACAVIAMASRQRKELFSCHLPAAKHFGLLYPRELRRGGNVGRYWARRALLRWPNFSTQIKRAINHAHVTVSLWKIPQHAPIYRIKFIGQQANVVAAR